MATDDSVVWSFEARRRPDSTGEADVTPNAYANEGGKAGGGAREQETVLCL